MEISSVIILGNKRRPVVKGPPVLCAPGLHEDTPSSDSFALQVTISLTVMYPLLNPTMLDSDLFRVRSRILVSNLAFVVNPFVLCSFLYLMIQREVNFIFLLALTSIAILTSIWWIVYCQLYISSESEAAWMVMLLVLHRGAPDTGRLVHTCPIEISLPPVWCQHGPFTTQCMCGVPSGSSRATPSRLFLFCREREECDNV
jgi:hypothetical protein